MGGCKRHVVVLMFFLHETKEVGLIIFKHIPGAEKKTNIFTKNIDALASHKDIKKLCGDYGLYAMLK